MCIVETCGREAVRVSMCRMHYKRWFTHGDPSVVLPRGGDMGVHPKGPEHPSWQIDRLSYSGAHMRVRAARGPASDYECSCGSRASHWAYDHSDPAPLTQMRGKTLHVFSPDVSRYLPLCVPCHKREDLSRKRAFGAA